MRLLKLIAWGVLGYVIYELYRGMTEAGGAGTGTPSGGRASHRRRRRRSDTLERALNEDPGRMNLTGGGRGTTVSTEDTQGGRSNRVVGRGVISET